MNEIRETIRQCTNCHLAAAHNGPVPGYFGKPYGLLIIGEAPGHEEDIGGSISLDDIQDYTGKDIRNPKQFLKDNPEIHNQLRLKKLGMPFVGKSGRYLRAKLKEFKFPSQYISFANSISCRPTGRDNRDPSPAELFACRNNISSQIAHSKPRVILSVGKISARLFYSNIKLTLDHGRPVWLSKFRIQIPTYHPAFILRKKREWEHVFEADLAEARKKLWSERLGEDWPEDCRVCKKPVAQYDTFGLAYCKDHYIDTQRPKYQPGLF